jgi:hypothetical protein
VDLKRLTMADYVIAGGTLLFLVLAALPWYDYDDLYGFSYSFNGFSSGLVSTAFVLFLLATVWALLPAFVDLELGFPRGWVTVGLAALGFLLALLAWFDTFSVGFSIFALLGVVVAAAILLFAVLSLLPELRNRPALPGSLAGAAQWANQQAPEYGRPAGSAGLPADPGPYGQYGRPPQPWGQPQPGRPGAYGRPDPHHGRPAQQYGQPDPYGQPAPQHPPTPPPGTDPGRPGGSTPPGQGGS